MDNTIELSTFEKFKLKTEKPFFILLVSLMLGYILFILFFAPIGKEQIDTFSFEQIEDMLLIHELTNWLFVFLFVTSSMYGFIYNSVSLSNKNPFMLTIWLILFLSLLPFYLINYEKSDLSSCYATPNFILGQNDYVKNLMKNNIIVKDGLLVKKEYFDIKNQTITAKEEPYLIKDVINLAAYQQKPH
jgi:magnesium-transporting ATPase (P-type)